MQSHAPGIPASGFASGFGGCSGSGASFGGGTARGGYRDAGGTEVINVAIDGSDRYLELVRKRLCADAAACLQQHHHGEQAACTHRNPSLAEIHDIWCQV